MRLEKAQLKIVGEISQFCGQLSKNEALEILLYLLCNLFSSETEIK